MRNFLSCIIAATLGLWLAVLFVPGVSVALHSDSNFFGVSITAYWQLYLLLGVILGLLNFFIKPILKTISLPLEIITLGLFTFVINMALVFVVDYEFAEFSAPFLWPLLWTSLVIWGLGVILSLTSKHHD